MNNKNKINTKKSLIDFKVYEPLINYDAYKESIYTYIYYLIGFWHKEYFFRGSIILLRAVAYNYVELYRQKFEKEGCSYRDLFDYLGLYHTVPLGQAYLELARAVKDGNYKLISIDKLMLPAEQILETLYKVDPEGIEKLRAKILSGEEWVDRSLVEI